MLYSMWAYIHMWAYIQLNVYRAVVGSNGSSRHQKCATGWSSALQAVKEARAWVCVEAVEMLKVVMACRR